MIPRNVWPNTALSCNHQLTCMPRLQAALVPRCILSRRDEDSGEPRAVIEVMSDVYEAADAGSVTLLGLLDLSAAFDTVDHRILLDRLGHDYGIGGLAIQWIGSYLTGRSQFVRFNGVTSRTVPVTSGVPQGSVLGPILFISYSAAVIAIVRHHGFKVHAFADDLQIYGSTAQNGAADLMARMSNCVESVASWMSSNRLRLNPSKTSWFGWEQVAVCSTAPVSQWASVELTSVRLSAFAISVSWSTATWRFWTTSTTWLASAFTSYASYASSDVHWRRKLHTRLSGPSSTPESNCNGLLAAGPKYLHEKLQCVLRAAARLVLQLPHRASVSDIMRRQLHWLEMPDRIRFKLCTLVFRCLHGLAPRYLSDLSARLPRCTLTSDHLWHLKDLC